MKYIPEVCSEGKLEGFIEVNAPTRRERLKLAKEVSTMKGDDFDKAEFLENKLNDVITVVEIKNIAADIVHKSIDDMGKDPECDALFSELHAKLVQGFPLGKN